MCPTIPLLQACKARVQEHFSSGRHVLRSHREDFWVGQHWVKTKPLDRHQTRQCWTKGEDMLAWQGVALRVQEGLKGQSTDASWRVRGRPQRKGGVQFRNLHEVTLALARASHVGVSLGCLKIQDALH